MACLWNSVFGYKDKRLQGAASGNAFGRIGKLNENSAHQCKNIHVKLRATLGGYFGEEAKNFISEEKLERAVLLRGYTIDGARQLRQADKMGSLEPGKLANLAVISQNFFEVPPEEISKIKFETVIFEGRVVHGRL